MGFMDMFDSAEVKVTRSFTTRLNNKKNSGAGYTVMLGEVIEAVRQLQKDAEKIQNKINTNDILEKKDLNIIVADISLIDNIIKIIQGHNLDGAIYYDSRLIEKLSSIKPGGEIIRLLKKIADYNKRMVEFLKTSEGSLINIELNYGKNGVTTATDKEKLLGFMERASTAYKQTLERCDMQGSTLTKLRDEVERLDSVSLKDVKEELKRIE